MRAQDEETEYFGIVLPEDFLDGEEIAERFRHLLVIDTNEPVVHPVVDEATLVRAFRLRDLVLVVGKLEILPATVDVCLLYTSGCV